MRRVHFRVKPEIYFVENWSDFNRESTRMAMSEYSSNLAEKGFLGARAFRRMCVLPNASFNTFINSQNSYNS